MISNEALEVLFILMGVVLLQLGVFIYFLNKISKQLDAIMDIHLGTLHDSLRALSLVLTKEKLEELVEKAKGGDVEADNFLDQLEAIGDKRQEIINQWTKG